MLNGLRVGHWHRLVTHLPRREHLVEEPVAPAVSVVRDEHMVARAADGPQQAVLGRHAGGKGERPGPALQRGQALLQRGPGRVHGPGVLVAGPGIADAVLGVGGDLVDRRHHGTGHRVGVLPGVDRQRFEPAAGPARPAGSGGSAGHDVPPARKASTSCGVIMPAGRPSTRTTAAPAFSSASTALLTSSPDPTIGSGADMCAPTGSLGLARPETSASSRSRSTTEPITSATMTGGSSFITGSWDTLYSRRMPIAAATVSSGWACTKTGRPPCLRASTSAILGSAVCPVRNP